MGPGWVGTPCGPRGAFGPKGLPLGPHGGPLEPQGAPVGPKGTPLGRQEDPLGFLEKKNEARAPLGPLRKRT